MSLHGATEILRDSTRELHSRIEATRFARDFLNKKLKVESYVGYIRVMAVIHAVLERKLDACEHPLVAEIWCDELRRLPELLEDHDQYRWACLPDAAPAIEAALGAASHILLVFEENPIALLGGLYVLGGSTKGAVILSPLARDALDLAPGRGLSYLTRHGGQGPTDWEEAASKIDSRITDPEHIKSMTETAVFIFECLLAAFEALAPPDRSSMGYFAATLNPEAGNHPVPQDKRDIQAVLRATERCLAEYPYFVYRYGQRGRRFSDADGAWLTTLPQLGGDNLRAQIKWLGGVLASRGMPRILLARHMQILAEELIVARPNQVERSGLLEEAAAEIIQDVETRFPPDLIRKFIGQVETACGLSGKYAQAEAITLLTSAVADEAKGIEGVVDSLTDWLFDSARYSSNWIAAMKDILKSARREASAE